MLDHYPNPTTAKAADSDLFEARRAELSRLSPLKRIPAIEADLTKVKHRATAAATFHRKKLLRMHDAARLEAKLVTPAQLQRENSPFAHLDFAKASIIWRNRSRVRA